MRKFKYILFFAILFLGFNINLYAEETNNGLAVEHTTYHMIIRLGDLLNKDKDYSKYDELVELYFYAFENGDLGIMTSNGDFKVIDQNKTVAVINSYDLSSTAVWQYKYNSDVNLYITKSDFLNLKNVFTYKKSISEGTGSSICVKFKDYSMYDEYNSGLNNNYEIMGNNSDASCRYFVDYSKKDNNDWQTGVRDYDPDKDTLCALLGSSYNDDGTVNYSELVIGLRFAFTIIKVVAIILLIVFAMIDFASVINKGGEIMAAVKRWVTRTIVLVLLLLLPTFVEIIGTIAGYSDLLCGIK